MMWNLLLLGSLLLLLYLLSRRLIKKTFTNKSSIHGQGIFASTDIKKGDIIKKGQLVGYMGDTGSSTGPHLHWSVKKGGKILHPADFYPSGWILLKESTNPLVETRRNMTAYPTHTPSKAVTNPVV